MLVIYNVSLMRYFKLTPHFASIFTNLISTKTISAHTVYCLHQRYNALKTHVPSNSRRWNVFANQVSVSRLTLARLQPCKPAQQQRHEGSMQLRGSSRKEMYFLRRPTVTSERKQQSVGNRQSRQLAVNTSNNHYNSTRITGPLCREACKASDASSCHQHLTIQHNLQISCYKYILLFESVTMVPLPLSCSWSFQGTKG